jgi:hypothetical protein
MCDYEGTGVIKFFFDQDTTRNTPCPKCYPERKDEYNRIQKQFHKGFFE